MSRRLTAIALAALAGAAGAGSPADAGSKVRQMIVLRDGTALTKTVSTRAVHVRLGARRCNVGRGTALAALVRSRPGRLRLRDFGSCSLKARDGAGLFVRGIHGDINHGQDGWVYKVGRRAATAGAADPGGPFGRGRLHTGQRVTWLYCRLRPGGCQRTLELKASGTPGTLVATVRGYDDEGHGVPVAGATVRAGAASAQTDADGTARLAVAPGSYLAVAEKAGMVRSFAERVEVP